MQSQKDLEEREERLEIRSFLGMVSSKSFIRC